MALTFDDGPHPSFTPRIARHLEDQARTRRFCVGSAVERNLDVVRALVAAGHEIGNHSYSHNTFGDLFVAARLAGNLARNQALLSTCAPAPRFYRPVAGVRNPKVHAAARQVGLSVVTWTAAPRDGVWTPTPEKMRRLGTRARPGDIIALHDGTLSEQTALREATVRALPILLELLRARGLSLRHALDAARGPAARFDAAAKSVGLIEERRRIFAGRSVVNNRAALAFSDHSKCRISKGAFRAVRSFISYRSLRVAVVAAALVVDSAAVRGETAPGEAARDALAQARQASDAGRLPQAIEAYKRAYELSGDLSLLFQLGEVNRRLGQDVAAIRFYRSYLARDPRGKYREAAERAARTLELQPSKPATAAAAAPPAPRWHRPLPRPSVFVSRRHRHPSRPRLFASRRHPFPSWRSRHLSHRRWRLRRASTPPSICARMSPRLRSRGRARRCRPRCRGRG